MKLDGPAGISGEPDEPAAKPALWVRGAAFVLDVLLLFFGGRNIPLPLPVYAGFILFLVLLHTVRPTWPRRLLRLVYALLIVNVIDQILPYAGLIWKSGHGLWRGALLSALPLALIVAVARSLRPVGSFRVALAVIVAVAGVGSAQLIEWTAPDADAIRAANPRIVVLQKFAPPMGLREAAREILVDARGGQLYVGFRHRTYRDPGDGYVPLAAERIDLKSREVTAYRFGGAQELGMALDSTDGTLLLSLASREPMGLVALPDDAERAIVRLRPDGTVLAAREIPGESGDYASALIPREGGWLHYGSMYWSAFDDRLSPRPSDVRFHGDGWTFSSSAFGGQTLFRCYMRQPIVFLLANQWSIDAVRLDPPHRIATAQDSPSGCHLIAASPDGQEAVALNHNLFDLARVTVYDRFLLPRHVYRIGGVSRSFAVDFHRRRFGVVGWTDGVLRLFDLDDGRLLDAIALGSGSRAMAFGPDGTVYAGLNDAIVAVTAP